MGIVRWEDHHKDREVEVNCIEWEIDPDDDDKGFVKLKPLSGNLREGSTSVPCHCHIVWYERKPCGSKVYFFNDSLENSRGCKFRSRD
jgi:hypothetical protein